MPSKSAEGARDLKRKKDPAAQPYAVVEDSGALAMASALEFRQRAIDCLRLADEATNVYAKVALTDLADDFRHMAEAIDRRNSQDKAS